MLGGWQGHYLMLSDGHIQSQFKHVKCTARHVEMEMNAFDLFKGIETLQQGKHFPSCMNGI